MTKTTSTPQLKLMVELAVSLGNELTTDDATSRQYFKDLSELYGYDMAYWFLRMVVHNLVDDLYDRFDNDPHRLWDAWFDQVESGRGGVFLYDAATTVLDLLKKEPHDVVMFGDPEGTALRVARAANDRLFSQAPQLEPLAEQITFILTDQ